jgi:hypothetical protein
MEIFGTFASAPALDPLTCIISPQMLLTYKAVKQASFHKKMDIVIFANSLEKQQVRRVSPGRLNREKD